MEDYGSNGYRFPEGLGSICTILHDTRPQMKFSQILFYFNTQLLTYKSLIYKNFKSNLRALCQVAYKPN